MSCCNRLDASHRRHFTSAAALQYCQVLTFLLNCDFVLRKLRPSNSARRKCLVKAAAEILWRAGEERRATVVMYDHTFSKKKISYMQSSSSRRKRSHERHTSLFFFRHEVQNEKPPTEVRLRLDTTSIHTGAAHVFPVGLQSSLSCMFNPNENIPVCLVNGNFLLLFCPVY